MLHKVHVCLSIAIAISLSCKAKTDDSGVVSATAAPGGSSPLAIPSMVNGVSPLAAVGLQARGPVKIVGAKKTSAPPRAVTTAPGAGDDTEVDARPGRTLVAQGKTVAEDDPEERDGTPAPKTVPAPRKKGRIIDDSPRSVVEVTVRRGESMGMYGLWAKVPMRELYKRASLRWNEKLAVGRKLSFELSQTERGRFDPARAAFHEARDGAFAKTTATSYVVRQGDNSWRIARRRGVPLTVLERMNPNRDLSRLQVGDKIQVPSTGGEG